MRDRSEFVQLIDRYRLGQAQRLVIGARLSSDFSSVNCSLTLAEGRGKFLRPRWIENRKTELPKGISRACRNLQTNPDSLLREFGQVKIDLSRVLASAINEIATLSGVHAKMLLAVCIDEPGLWSADYDGKETWQPFVAPEQLAELTGLTIVDSLPSRDLAAAGRGWPLHPLPYWLLFADRNTIVADSPRLLIKLGEYTELVWLPESDGLDDELPAIRFARFPGSGLEEAIMKGCGLQGLSNERRDDLGAQGKVSVELSRLWNDFVEHNDLTRKTPPKEATDQLEKATLEIMQTECLPPADALASLSSHITIATKRFLAKRGHNANCQLIVGGQLGRHGLLLSELNQVVGQPWMATENINYQSEFLDAAATSMLGLMHIDQMPMTVPWISGSEIPRVLGRVTPGSPANWRRVIMEMGDCRPPVMKLREAV